MSTTKPEEADPRDVERRLELLEAENARLRAAAGAPSGEAKPERSFSWRSFGAATLIVLATILSPAAILSGWAKGLLVDEDTFVSTLAPLAKDPAIQAEITDQVSAVILEELDVEVLVADTFSGLTYLDMPQDAKNALSLLRAPAAEGAKSLIRQSVQALIETDRFEKTWRAVLAASHRTFVTAAGGSAAGGRLTLDDQGYIAFNLGPVVADVKAGMLENGLSLAEQIPEVDATIILARSDALGYIGPLYRTAVTLGWLFPVGVMALSMGGIALARNPRKGVIGAGIGLVIGSGITLIAVQGVQLVVAVQAGNLGISPAALSAIFAYLVTNLRLISSAILVIGALLVLLGWVTGRSPAALALQGVADTGTSQFAVTLTEHGYSGAFIGEWLQRNRTLVRVLLIVLLLSLLLIFKTAPVTLAWIAALGLFLWWVVVVLEKTAPSQTVDIHMEVQQEADV